MNELNELMAVRDACMARVRSFPNPVDVFEMTPEEVANEVCRTALLEQCETINRQIDAWE